jgi:hypothetical protein
MFLVPLTTVVPGPVTAKLDAVTLDAWMASLKVALMVVEAGTFWALDAGVVEATVGPVSSAAVVKLQIFGASSGLPARSFTAVVSVAV